jgi:hypothetical protein
MGNLMRWRSQKRCNIRWAAALLAMLVTIASRGADVEGSLGASSDNVFRGLSLSDGQPSLLADVHASDPQWFGGLAADMVRLEPRDFTEAQAIGYLGYQHPLGQSWNSTWSVRHYDYPGAPDRSRYHYDELAAALSWQDQLFVQLIGSPDSYALDDYHTARAEVMRLPRISPGASPCRTASPRSWNRLLRPFGGGRRRLPVLECRPGRTMGCVDIHGQLHRHRLNRAPPVRLPGRRAAGYQRRVVILRSPGQVPIQGFVPRSQGFRNRLPGPLQPSGTVAALK